MSVVEKDKKQMSVLVVDDFQTVREMMKGCLRQLGYQDITLACDGAEAVELIKSKQFDLILCDWHMPKVLGIDVLRAVRKSPAGKGIPFILATSESEQGCVLQAVDAGVSNYIIKPFTVDTLKAKIESAFKKAKAMASLPG